MIMDPNIQAPLDPPEDPDGGTLCAGDCRYILYCNKNGEFEEAGMCDLTDQVVCDDCAVFISSDAMDKLIIEENTRRIGDSVRI